MNTFARLRHAAGVAAILAGLCWLGWVAGSIITQGAIDRASPASPPLLDWLGRLLMVGWNILLLPAALVLWESLRARRQVLVTAATLAGSVSLLLWAYGGATRSISMPFEVAYITLSAFWWTVIGIALREERRRFGTFTLVLGLVAGFDAVVTLLGEGLPFIFLPLAGLKLPLSWIWNFWLGRELLRRSQADSSAQAPLPAN